MNGRMNKILFVITKSIWGGPQKYVYDLATNMPRVHYDVAVLCGGDGVLADKLNNANISVITADSLRRAGWFFRGKAVFSFLF